MSVSIGRPAGFTEKCIINGDTLTVKVKTDENGQGKLTAIPPGGRGEVVLGECTGSGECTVTVGPESYGGLLLNANSNSGFNPAPFFYAYDPTGGTRIMVTVFDRDTMARLYVTPEELASWLGLTRLGEDQWCRLVRVILEKMEYVDRITNSTWNGRTKRWKQYYSMKLWKAEWPFFAGAPIHLEHRCIREVTRLEYFTGRGYKDVTSHLRYSRGDGDVWLDRVKGVLYWQHFFFFMGGKEFYIEYTYGCDELPQPVRELTLLLAARDVLVNERRLTQAPASDNLSLMGQLQWIEQRIRELEGVLRAWRVYTD